MNEQSIDLDIHNYSIPELKQLLKIEDPLTANDVKEVIQKTITHLRSAGEGEYTQFFEHVQIKLLISLDEPPNPMITDYGGAYVQSQPQYDLLHTPHVVHNGRQLVVEKNAMPTQDIFANEYPTGVLNPIRRRTVTQMVNIDTLFRENYELTSSTDFLYTFPLSLDKVVSMRLSVIELPNVWHTFSTARRNNVFTISTFNASTFADTIHTVIIPDGNYTSSELIDAMNNLFHNTGLGLQFLHFDINPYTFKTIIRARNQAVGDAVTGDPFPFDPADPHFSPAFSFTVDFRLSDDLGRSLRKNVGWILGFRQMFYIIDSTNTLVDSIEFPSIITYEGYLESLGAFGSSVNQYLFFSVDDFNKSVKNSIVSEHDQSYIGDNLLGRITVSTGSNTIIMDNGFDHIFKKREYFGPVKLKKIRVRLLNKFGEVVDLNDNDYSFALEFTQLYS